MGEMEGHKRTRTMNMDFEGFVEDDDDDDFFDAYNRASAAAAHDLTSSDDSDDDYFEDSRMSFSSVVSSAVSSSATKEAEEEVRCPSPVGVPIPRPNYDVWMAVPGSIRERRKKLFVGMGLESNKELLKENSIRFSRKLTSKLSKKVLIPPAIPKPPKSSIPPSPPPPPPPPPLLYSNSKKKKHQHQQASLPAELVRSRSEGEIRRRPGSELIGKEPRDRLKRTRSDASRIVLISDPALIAAAEKLKSRGGGGKSRAKDDEIGAGYSPVVKELMRRESMSHEIIDNNFKKFGPSKSSSSFSNSIKLSKLRGASLLTKFATNFKVPTAKSSAAATPALGRADTRSHSKREAAPSRWIKVRQVARTHKDLSALHMCQEIQAHEGSIWTMRFDPDGRFLASAGEGGTIHVWEVQEYEVTSQRILEEGAFHSASPVHPSLADAQQAPSGRKKKIWGKKSSIPDYVHVPETVFALSEKPACSFEGHTDDVLDLSWSKSQLLISSSMDKTVRLWDMETKSCLSMFPHNDYVTGIQFNPANDSFFISGSLDGKVRIWNIDDHSLSSYTEVYEMVTAVCYSSDGQDALIGTHKGNYRVYGTEDCKLEEKGQVEAQYEKSQAKKITGLQYHPKDPSEVLVTCADSRVRIFNGEVVVHKFKGFKNTSSQIAAYFCKDGKYVLSASEDSHVYLWKREGRRLPGSGKGKIRIKTRAHESFFCKDVSVAIPWPRSMKGEPQGRSSKKQSKVSTNSPPKEDNKSKLPPLPKGEEAGDQVSSRTDSGVGGSYNSDSSTAASGRSSESPSTNAASSNQSSSSSWSWLDIGIRGYGSGERVTAWGLVIVTAGLTGELRVYQNFGLPRRLSRQATLFLNKEN